MSLAGLRSRITFCHESGPPRPALPFPFSPKREKQRSSSSHPLGLGVLTSAQRLRASLSPQRLVSPVWRNTGGTTPLVGCEWPDFLWRDWEWDCHRWRLILRSWCVPARSLKLPLRLCLHGRGWPRSWSGFWQGLWRNSAWNGWPWKSPPLASSMSGSFISHPLASGQLLLCLQSTTSSPRHGEPSTQRVLSLPLQLLSPLVDAAEEKGYT